MSSSGGSTGGTPSDTVTGPDTFGQAAVAGTSTEYSRGDHGHGLPEAAGGSAIAGYPASPVAMGAGIWGEICSVTLTAGTWLLSAMVEYVFTAGSDWVTWLAIGTSPASVDNSIAAMTGSSPGTSGTVSVGGLTALVTVSGPTVYYLNGLTNLSATAEANDTLTGSHCTSLIAVSI